MKYTKFILRYIEYFLLLFVIISELPFNHYTNPNIQSYFTDSLYYYDNNYRVLTRLIFITLLIISYIKRDGILFGLLLFYKVHLPEQEIKK